MMRLLLVLCLVLISPLAHSTPPEADPNAVFPVELITIETGQGAFQFTAEIADEDSERSRGLMFRETMKPTHGMLFDFGKLQPVFMWMENTPLSLDMIFILPTGKVARIESDTQPFSRSIISSSQPVSHVLELNAGMAKYIGLKPGDEITHRLFGNNSSK